ncbi:hypothetical protein JAO73_06130 [Hymenobacter sp. BT523]|uniref:hypothetical protein n=1 Tax=Hymenobacter sp. BT523 TaxID=2795725 RepID=UPI0018EB8C65|nr:hypothetical protein [Hymenobacter sp. BT523]MBJ6108575.1 hypothetical protein [Hymenobacter sp. BT523]
MAGLLAAACGWAGAQENPKSAAAPRQSQAQAAHQFLRAVLRADYSVAYRRLAPEVQHTISLARFEASARPLWRSGQKHRQAIELYKLGVRLGDGGASRLFYAFSFAADSAIKPPPVLLEVTFRDTTSRAVLGFGLRPNIPSKPAKPSMTPRKR